MTDHENRVLRSIAAHQWGSAKIVAEATGLSRAQVRRHVKALEAAEKIVVIKFGGGGFGYYTPENAPKWYKRPQPARLPWGERRALGVEYDELEELAYEGELGNDGQTRIEELDKILKANPLDSYSSEEIDAYNLHHFGDASGRGPRIHRSAESFAKASGLSMEMIQAHGITSFNSATGRPIHVLQEGA
ncbi:MAG: hypothetical protein V3T81_02600 [Thermoanaerobaculia bacterium]